MAGDWVDLNVGVDFMDGFKGPPEGRDKDNVRLVGGAAAAVDATEDAAVAVEDTSARVTLVEERGSPCRTGRLRFRGSLPC